ncbi:XRE family transcriptional regulator [Wohlfahrtiimonas populi]|uniref:XRE family transcriptional regulator n=1 Tax=Wohlfahrtiimonas populi TaxID=1940240 RepID=UPI00098D2DDC|nr:S24 family peptidase [Wohlfahrtiimonas populi]
MESNNELGKRIKMRRLELGMKQDDFEEFGLSQASISKLERGEYKKTPQIADLAKALKTTTEWLMYGGDVVPINKNSQRDPSVEYHSEVSSWDKNTQLPQGMRAIPYYTETCASAGNGCEAIEDDTEDRVWLHDSFFIAKGIKPEDAFCMRVRGDSMYPIYMNGSTIAVDRGAVNIIDGDAYVVNYSGDVFIKYLRRISPDTVLLTSENSAYPALEAKTNDLKIIGRVCLYISEK